MKSKFFLSKLEFYLHVAVYQKPVLNLKRTLEVLWLIRAEPSVNWFPKHFWEISFYFLQNQLTDDSSLCLTSLKQTLEPEHVGLNIARDIEVARYAMEL